MKNRLPKEPILASAPCRVDLGGTLDIGTFYLPLARFRPVTFNAAIDLRTRVSVEPYDEGMVKVSSKGFESAEFPSERAPFDHPLGLMFATAAHFGADGVHIEIESSSPVRSALGGSSSAAVALVAAFLSAFSTPGEKGTVARERIALLAHAIEQSVAGVPCGIQDQLAAVYGGVNAWRWTGRPDLRIFERIPLFEKFKAAGFSRHLLVAYCGIPHESKDINGRWVRSFVSGEHRKEWREIVECAQSFVDALLKGEYKEASRWMNRETEIRCEMTPDVLDETGKRLSRAAKEAGCGARFTGAGGGGCVWATGEAGDIRQLEDAWKGILSETPDACLLRNGIDTDGLQCDRLCFSG